MSDTRRRILDLARELFNREGLSRVGPREIARALEMSPGNLAYHFPTKDDLVAALVEELHELNAQSMLAEPDDGPSMVTMYHGVRHIMQNDLRYRFVLLNYVDAVASSAHLQRLESTL